jgi:hypothetical protein
MDFSASIEGSIHWSLPSFTLPGWHSDAAGNETNGHSRIREAMIRETGYRFLGVPFMLIGI